MQVMQPAEVRFGGETSDWSPGCLLKACAWRSLVQVSMDSPSIVIVDAFIHFSLQQVLRANYQPVTKVFVADSPYPARRPDNVLAPYRRYVFEIFCVR